MLTDLWSLKAYFRFNAIYLSITQFNLGVNLAGRQLLGENIFIYSCEKNPFHSDGIQYFGCDLISVFTLNYSNNSFAKTIADGVVLTPTCNLQSSKVPNSPASIEGVTPANDQTTSRILLTASSCYFKIFCGAYIAFPHVDFPFFGFSFVISFINKSWNYGICCIFLQTWASI